MMGDRGVLMEELLMAQEAKIISDRTAARAKQRFDASDPPSLTSDRLSWAGRPQQWNK